MASVGASLQLHWVGNAPLAHLPAGEAATFFWRLQYVAGEVEPGAGAEGRDADEMQTRCRRDAAEMQPRCSRATAEGRGVARRAGRGGDSTAASTASPPQAFAGRHAWLTKEELAERLDGGAAGAVVRGAGGVRNFSLSSCE